MHLRKIKTLENLSECKRVKKKYRKQSIQQDRKIGEKTITINNKSPSNVPLTVPFEFYIFLFIIF